MQTLTNKTLTTPTVTSPTGGLSGVGVINDSSGNEVMVAKTQGEVNTVI